MCWPSVNWNEQFSFRLDKPNPAFDVVVLQYLEVLAKLIEKMSIWVNVVIKYL